MKLQKVLNSFYTHDNTMTIGDFNVKIGHSDIEISIILIQIKNANFQTEKHLVLIDLFSFL